MENDNPKGISEVERIKWLVSRIDLYHSIVLNSIESAQKIFDNVEAKILNKIKSWRRGIFSILGAIVSAMFGINTFDPLDVWIIYGVLASVSVAGFLNYLILSFIENSVESSMALLSNITNQSQNYISESQQFVASHFADLGYLELKSVKNYGVFVLLLHVAIAVNMAHQLKRQKNIKNAWLIDILQEEFKKVEKITKNVTELYQRFDESQEFPPLSYELIEKTLKKYKPK